MTEPLFEVTRPKPSGVALAAINRVQHLRDQGLIEPRHEVIAAMVEQLSADMSMTHKAYALANLSKALTDALDLLPREPDDSSDDPMTQVHAILQDLRNASAGWEPAHE